MWEANLTSNMQVSYSSSKERHFYLLPRANSHFLWRLQQMGRRLCSKTSDKRYFICKERLLRQAPESSRTPGRRGSAAEGTPLPCTLACAPSRGGVQLPQSPSLSATLHHVPSLGAPLCSPSAVGNCSARREATLEVEGVNPPRSNNQKSGDW